MKKELEQALVKDFPNLYRDINAPMQQTCMCWGFDCGDGWEPIIRKLSEKLEKMIIEKVPDVTTEKLVEFRKMKKRVLTDHKLVYLDEPEFTEESLEDHLNRYPHIRMCPTWNEENKSYLWQVNPRWSICAAQIKEKFGTLRFYMQSELDGMHELISHAEEESSKTCEICGELGTLYTDGWHKVRCWGHKHD